MIEEKKKYHHGDLREQLIAAVRELVERDGPEKWSIADACRLAGVSTAAPYRHFRDRDDLLRQTVMKAMGRLAEKMQTAADAHPAGAPQRIVALGQAYLGFAREEPGLFRIMFSLTDKHAGDADLTGMSTNARLIVDRVVADHLGLAVDNANVRARAFSLWCFVHGYSFLQLDAKSKADAAAVPEDTLLDLVGEAILPTRQT